MGENAIPVHPYLIYASVSFLFLVLLALLVTTSRVMFMIGKMDGRLTGLETAIADLRQDNATLRQGHANLETRIDHLETRIDHIQEQLANLREQVAENRGLILALHERIDLVMSHRHDQATGNVILTPAVADPVAD
jgi:uncharacterized coiled-coil protein SlyX